MMSQTLRKSERTSRPVPTWEIAHLFPAQGQWSEDEYLALNGNRHIEFSHGFLEVLPMPTTSHQLLVVFLHALLAGFAAGSGLGLALLAPLSVRLWRGKFREPDVVFMRQEHADRIEEDFWRGADLVMEVVSGAAEDRRRDLVTKREEYARARIPEYWIVDPQEQRIVVLKLAGKQYAVHGEFAPGSQATSWSLPGFQVDVTQAFAQRLARRGKKPTRPKQK
jgi:Uma2 family endonuclease